MKKTEVLKNRTIKEITTEKAINSLLCSSIGTEKESEKDKILFDFFKKSVKQTAGCSLAGGLKKLPSRLDGKKMGRRCKSIAGDGSLERVDLSSDFFTIADKFILSEIVSLLNPAITCVYCGTTDEFYFYDRTALRPYGLFIKSVTTDLIKITSIGREPMEVKIKNSSLNLWDEQKSVFFQAFKKALEKETKNKVSA
jgi:hypothetical protein